VGFVRRSQEAIGAFVESRPNEIEGRLGEPGIASSKEQKGAMQNGYGVLEHSLLLMLRWMFPVATPGHQPLARKPSYAPILNVFSAISFSQDLGPL
jgi:hypothetical protein